MKKYTVTASMNVGYETIIKATSEEEAWRIAKEGGDTLYWEKVDDGHDWTFEQIWENNNE